MKPTNAAAPALLRGGDLIVEYLVREQVPYLFGVCGHGNIGLLDAALTARDRIKTVMTHHEQTAGFMAEAYYKVSHQPVATYTSCGPGSCNLPVALASAMMDSAAYLAITGNVPTSQFNRNAFQESGKFFQADFPSVIRPYVKRSFQPARVDMLPLALKQAFGLLRTGRPGPVNLDVPLNLFVEQAAVEIPQPDLPVAQRSPGDPRAVRQAYEMLASAHRPVIVAGQGVLLSEASEELRAFAELTDIPVATSPNGKGSIDEMHALALGPIGRNGSYAANGASSQSDVILALGFSFDDRASSAWLPGYTFTIPPTRLIQVDIDPTEIGRNYPVELGILADIQAFLRTLIDVARASAPRRAPDAWLSQLRERRTLWHDYHAPLGASEAMPIRPERFVTALGKAVPPEAIVAVDVGSHHNWLVELWSVRRPRSFLQSWGFGSMGFATSGILGAKLAAPDAPCIAVVGDGSFLMTAHAVATAVEYSLPIVWVVWNNFGFTSIRDLQLGAFQRELDSSFRHTDTGELYSPDFASLARAFGADGVRVEKPADLEDTLVAALRSGRPSLVEVMIDREIRPVSTGGWELPPLPPAQPNFERLALGRK